MQLHPGRTKSILLKTRVGALVLVVRLSIREIELFHSAPHGGACLENILRTPRASGSCATAWSQKSKASLPGLQRPHVILVLGNAMKCEDEGSIADRGRCDYTQLTARLEWQKQH